MTALFGTDDLSIAETAPAEERTAVLVDLHKQQLRDIAKLQYALDFETRRAQGTVAHHVAYATRSLTGVEKFKDAMCKVDPSTGSTFSDRHWNQGSLLTGSNIELSQPQHRLSEQFGGHDVPIERLEEFTLVDTPFPQAPPAQRLEGHGEPSNDCGREATPQPQRIPQRHSGAVQRQSRHLIPSPVIKDPAG